MNAKLQYSGVLVKKVSFPKITCSYEIYACEMHVYKGRLSRKRVCPVTDKRCMPVRDACL